ncbi:MAG TPA: LysM peptidoglycan-binding domain-containing protein, partial [Adhaeribacter sp.]|nr:LysM peptidoglycan-binding domain-containing protein [Adhaeribacter sp.]
MKIRIIYGLCFSLLIATVAPAISAAPLRTLQNPAQGNPLTHTVVAKETLYGISRQYGVSVNDLLALNPEAKNGLQIGQVLKIPGKNTVTAEAKPTPAEARPKPTEVKPKVAEPAAAVVKTEAPAGRTFIVDAAGNKIHKVAPKQTLYSVAIMYGVTMADIRKWNNLKADALKVDQKLIVGVNEKAQSTAQYVPEKDDEVEMAKTAAKNTNAEVKPVAAAPAKEETSKSGSDETDDDRMENKTMVVANKVIETGLAEAISQPGDNNKFLALHKTAPVGSILQVKNIMNGQHVYVRVIGKLPETGANEKVIIRLSKRACQRLAAI